ncbi:MAG: glycoside hydrolase family 92 protein, partial [Bacteroidales bacterium]|nr:glycoside hydrolase family 92 protein [Bacteroidales bacterium]
TTPAFDRVEITLDPRWNDGRSKLAIEKTAGQYISRMTLGGKSLKSYRVSHSDLVDGEVLKFICR